jgi:hypothetical protein
MGNIDIIKNRQVVRKIFFDARLQRDDKNVHKTPKTHPP